MRIALIDDYLNELHILEEFLVEKSAEFGLRNVRLDKFVSGEQFLKSFYPGRYTAIICDIFMQDLSGIDTAKAVRDVDRDVVIIFCTSSNDFAVQSYEVQAGYYLQKPLTQKNVSRMLRQVDLAHLKKYEKIIFPNGFQCHIDKICYTKYTNHLITVNILGSSPYSFYFSQKDLENILLPHAQFVAVNRGCIVNLHNVQALRGEKMQMRDGTFITVSRRRIKQVKEAYENYLLNKFQNAENLYA